MVISESVKKKRVRKFKCPYCGNHYERNRLITHVEKIHSDMIPEGYTPARVVFNSINKKDHGTCVVCGKDAPWNENKCRYDRLCGDERCKKKYKEIVENRIKATHDGKTSRDLLLDPEQQNKMLKNRRISGTYTWSDGMTKEYVGNYEKKCLEFMDKVLKCNSEDVETPGPVVEYFYKGMKHFWITDIYYAPYKLAIDCKDGGANPNNRPMDDYRLKQDAKEKAIAKDNKYNYIRLTDNDFSQLMQIMADIKMLLIEDPMSEDKISHINEAMSMASICPMVGGPCNQANQDGAIVAVYKRDKDEEANVAVTKNIMMNTIFVQDEKDGKVKKVNKDFLKECRYNLYYYHRDGLDESMKEIIRHIGEVCSPSYIYETVFGKHCYTPDQIMCENMQEIIGYDDYIRLYSEAYQNITEASLKPVPQYPIPTPKEYAGNVQEYKCVDGYYIENTQTGIRTVPRKESRYTPFEQLIIQGGKIL